MSEPEVAQEVISGEPAPRYHWFHKFSAVLFVIFCLEIGLFLLVFPWTAKWNDNLFATILSRSIPHWTDFWQNAYFRGAVSGLGLTNLYISLSEVFRLRRFSQH